MWPCPGGRLLASVTQRHFGPVSCGGLSSPGVVRFDSALSCVCLKSHFITSIFSSPTASLTPPTVTQVTSPSSASMFSCEHTPADCDSVASRTSIKETCVDMDLEKVVSSLFGSVSNGEERSRPKRCANIERQAKSPQILGRKADSAVRGEKLAQQRLYEAEGDVQVKHRKRETRMLLFMTSIRSSSPNDYSYRRSNGLTRLRETKLFCMEKWN